MKSDSVRDVTPENILVSYEGQVKVTDFGVAKAEVAGRSETEPGVVKGKLLYLSPEQARGEKVDARTDVFALGVVLFRMLCGSHPFGGSDLNVMQQIAFGGEAAPSSLNPELDPELEQILLKAMARDKTARYASAQALLQALSTWLSRHAPTHPPDGLANLVGYLYEPELNALSRPVELPSSFLELVPLWQQVPVKHSAKSSKAETRPLRSPSKGQARAEVSSEPETQPRRGTAPLPARQGRSWVAFAAAAVGAVLLAGAGLFFATRPSTFTAKIETDPSGATVVIDGAGVQGMTPLTTELTPGAQHQVVVSHPGCQPWQGTVTGEAGELRAVWASLTKVQPPPPVVPVETPKKTAPPPVANPFDVDTAPATFKLSRSKMAVDLKTERMQTYELPPGDWLFHGEGDLTADWDVPPPRSADAKDPLAALVVTRRLFYAWFQPGKSDTVTVGFIEGKERGTTKPPKQTKIPGEARLKLFTLTEEGAKVSRLSYLVTGVNAKTKVGIGVSVDTFSVPFMRPVLREKIARVRSLDPDKAYTLRVTVPRGQGAGAVICAFGRAGEGEVPRWQKVDQMQLLEAPATFRFSEAATAWCAMLNLGPGSAEQVTVELE